MVKQKIRKHQLCYLNTIRNMVPQHLDPLQGGVHMFTIIFSRKTCIIMIG